MLGPDIILGGGQVTGSGLPRGQRRSGYRGAVLRPGGRRLASRPASLAAAEQAIMLAGGAALADEPYASWADAARVSSVTCFAGLGRRGRGCPGHRRRSLVGALHRRGDGGGSPRRGLRAAGTCRRWPRPASPPGPSRLRRTPGAARRRSGRRPGAADAGAAPAYPAPAGYGAAGPAPGRGPGSGCGPTGRGRAGLAGRAAETAALREAWGHAVAADPGLVMIIGEAGIGKTALAEDLASEAAEEGATVLRTRCYEAERSLFLQPVVEALAPVVTRMTAGALGQLLGEHGPPPRPCCPRWPRCSGLPRPGAAARRWNGAGPSRRQPRSWPGWPNVRPSCSSSMTCSTRGNPPSSSSTTSAVIYPAPGCSSW